MSDLVIRISAESGEFSDALDGISKQTENLEGNLATIAKASAIAFGALSAAVFLSAKAFAEEQKAIAEVNQSLQNQGIYTDALSKKYQDIASSIEKKTGIESEQILSGQALLQSFAGQTEITDTLTKAVVDLSVAKKIDLASAFEIVGKGVQGNLVGLNKLGLQIDENKSKSETLAQITEQLSQRFNGQAEAATSGIGSVKLLATAVGDLQKEFGARLAPALETVIRGLTNFVRTIQENKALLDFVTSVGAAVGVVSGLGLVVGTAGIAFLKLRAALLAAQVSTSAMSIAVKGLVGATGLGLIVILATEIYLNWNTIWPRMQAIFKAFTANIAALAGGLGDLLQGIFFLDVTKIQAGLTQIKAAFLKTYEEATAAIPQVAAAEKKQDEQSAALADKREAREEAARRRRVATQKAELELLQIQANGASKAEVDLKKEEVETLKQIEDEKNVTIRERLEEHLAIVAEMQAQQRTDQLEQEQEYQLMQFEQTEEYEALSAEQRAIFRETQLAEVQSTILTEDQYRTQAASKKLADQIKTHNTFLVNEKKFGKAYAELQRFMNTESVQGFKNATGELVALQGSSNKTLNAIGKSAAIAQIAIKTTESAMNIYAGFSTIPIIGPALGIAGAAAAVAYGAEQVRKVQSGPEPIGALEGGVISGGIAGQDSVPAFLAPGELVAPARNFEEVVTAVADSRARARNGGKDNEIVDTGPIQIVLELKDDLIGFIEAKIVERQNLNIATLGVG